MPVVAPYVTTYTSHVPYITLAEWLAAPTSLDIFNLVPGGTQEQQNAAIRSQIERASSWIDRICHQVLAATKDTSIRRCRVDVRGYVKMPLPRKPVLEVVAVSVGSSPSNMSALSTLVDVEIGEHGVVSIPVYNASLGRGSLPQPLVQVTYINGWPNTLLAANVPASASSLTVASSLGIYPGSVLSIYDTDLTGGTEQVTVASTFVPGGTTVPLTAPTQYAHVSGTSFSSLPPVVKEAAVLLTSALLQTRGADALVIGSTDPPQQTPMSNGMSQAERLASAMLADYRRVR